MNPGASQSKIKLQKEAIDMIAKTSHQVQMLKSKEKLVSNPPLSEANEVKKTAKETTKSTVDKYSNQPTSIGSP